LNEGSVIVEQIELWNGKVMRLVKGDITSRAVDVVVNASNSNLNNIKHVKIWGS